jgi:hypothetical protein
MCVGGRFGVLRQVSVKMTVFWDVMTWDLVEDVLEECIASIFCAEDVGSIFIQKFKMIYQTTGCHILEDSSPKCGLPCSLSLMNFWA